MLSSDDLLTELTAPDQSPNAYDRPEPAARDKYGAIRTDVIDVHTRVGQLKKALGIIRINRGHPTRSRADVDHGPLHWHLREIIERRGWTMADLAVVSGLSYQFITVLVRGQCTGVTWDTLIKLCYALKIQPGTLITLDPPPKVYRKVYKSSEK